MKNLQIFHQADYGVPHSWPEETKYLEIGESLDSKEKKRAITRIKNKKAISLNGYNFCFSIWWEKNKIYEERFCCGSARKEIVSLSEVIELIKGWGD